MIGERVQWLRAAEPTSSWAPDGVSCRINKSMPPPSSRGDPCPSFSSFVGKRMMRMDKIMACVVLVMFVPALPRFLPLCSRWEAALALAWAGSVLASLLWARSAPASYCRWREPFVAGLRIASWALPTTFLTARALLEGDPFQHRSPLVGSTLFLALLLLASGLVPRLQQAAGWQLPLPWLVPVLGAEVALTLPQVGALCAHPAMERPQAQRVLHAAHSALNVVFTMGYSAAAGAAAGANMVAEIAGSSSNGGNSSSSAGAADWGGGAQSFGGPGLGAGPASQGKWARQECFALVSMLQLSLCVALPLVVAAVRECVAFQEFRRQYRRARVSWWCGLYCQPQPGARVGAAAEGGWLRWGRLSLAAYSLLCGIWSLVLVLATEQG